jgi:hypothetical protein
MAEETPEIISLANDARLVLSSKQDCYYMATVKSCSCKAGQYGRMCKHRKPLLEGDQPSQAAIYQARQRELHARAKAGLSEPVDRIRSHEPFKPVAEVA